jgi:hypothetical protein
MNGFRVRVCSKKSAIFVQMQPLSKTSLLCDCGWIAQALNSSGSGVSFDAERNLFFFATENGPIFSLYHCPFCGGAFPDPSKPVWAPILTDDERERLERLFKGAKSAEELLVRMGKPNYDVVLTDGTRNIEFYQLSALANVECFVSEQGVECRIEMKPISARHF